MSAWAPLVLPDQPNRTSEPWRGCTTAAIVGRPMADLINRLYYGDNLGILRGLPEACVDLIYLDPPWNPKADYNVIFRDEAGRKSEVQRQAFAGTWHWGSDAEDHYAYLTQTARNHGMVPAPISTLVGALRSSGTTPVLAYVVEMTVRLVELHRVLKPSGSLFLHSDPTVSHYLKLVLDALFSGQNFQNEIIWKRTSAHNSAKRFGPVHDVILFYVKSGEAKFVRGRMAYSPGYIKSHFRSVDKRGRFQAEDLTGRGTRTGESGKPWRGWDPTTIGRHWQPASYVYRKYLELTGDDLAQYPFLDRFDKLDEVGLIYRGSHGEGAPRYRYYLADAPGVPLQDVWTDIAPINSQARERTGWGTQKPVALLERIIEAGSFPGDVILDPFCGCGTALDAAQSLDRRWVGIDITWHAIAVMKARMRARFGITCAVEGAPTEVEGARQLSLQHPDGREQFEAWALSLVGAIPHGGPQKRGADQGADGLITFSGPGGALESAIVSVKSGHVQAAHVQQLRGAMERHGASIGLFVTLEESTGPMRREAATAGSYHSAVSDRDYPRLQILTIRELIEDRRSPDLPPLLAASYRETIWSEVELPPILAKAKTARRPKPLAPRRPLPAPIPASELAGTLREGYAARSNEEDTRPSPAEPRSLRTSKRDRSVPLPSQESGDTD
jgi:DNA modification methylase